MPADLRPLIETSLFLNTATKRELLRALPRLSETDRTTLRDALSDHFQEWFKAQLVSLDPASQEDWNKARTALETKVRDVLARVQETREEQAERAQETRERAEQLSERMEFPTDTRFRPENLRTPEGIHEEFRRFQAQTMKMEGQVGLLSGEYARFREKTAAVAEPSEALMQTGIGILFDYARSKFVEEDPKIRMLKETQRMLGKQYAEFRTRLIQHQHEMRERGRALNAAPDALKAQIEERFAKRQEARGTDQERLTTERAEREQKLAQITETRETLVTLLHRTHDADAETVARQRSAAEATHRHREAKELLLTREERLARGMDTLQQAVSLLPEGRERDTVMERLSVAAHQSQELRGAQAMASEREVELTDATLQFDALRSQFGDQYANLQFSVSSLDTLGAEVEDVIHALDSHVLDLHADDLVDRLLFEEQSMSLDLLDGAIAEGVLDADVANQQMLNTVDSHIHDLAELSVSGPGFLETITHMRLLPNIGPVKLGAIPVSLAGVVDGWGHIFHGIDHGIQSLTGSSVRQSLDLAKDMPVLSLFAGLADGVGGVVHGIGTFVKQPTMLFRALGHAIRHPTKFLKAIVAYEDWQEGRYGYAFGKNVVEAALMLTGMHAAGAAGKAGKAAYTAARLQQGAGVARASLAAVSKGARTFTGALAHDVFNVPTTLAELPGRLMRGLETLGDLSGKGAARAAEHFAQLQQRLGAAIKNLGADPQALLGRLEDLHYAVGIKLRHPSMLLQDVQRMSASLLKLRSLPARARAALSQHSQGQTLLFEGLVMERFLSRLEKLEGGLHLTHKVSHRGHQADETVHHSLNESEKKRPKRHT